MYSKVRKFDNSVWDEDWFVRLPPKMKSLWFYIWSKCNDYGVWNVNLGVAWALIGERGITTPAAIENNFNSDGKQRISFFANGHKLLNHQFVKYHYGEKISLDETSGRKLFVYLTSENLERRIGGVDFIGNPGTSFVNEAAKARSRSTLNKIILNLPVPEETKFSPYMDGEEFVPASDFIVYNPIEAKKMVEPVPQMGITNLLALKEFVENSAKAKPKKIVTKITKEKIFRIVTKETGKVVDYQGYSEEQIVTFAAFESWINTKAKRVGKMKFPFTISEFCKMTEKYPNETIIEAVENMQKSKKLSAHTSAYVAFIGHVKRLNMVKNKES